ncbi:hypothetical protein FIBSPDRAFT_976277 [Athelia psychrophila]|uniref:Uncharacterized protein n=1 Tax=Athelia psychrophila TaxID=1759441 RepID=A0A166EZY3_9AGAM|nr:hypothetical protein FIBSPDRAFT_976277 [Fibularhizoctonia sp. CBS 109695]
MNWQDLSIYGFFGFTLWSVTALKHDLGPEIQKNVQYAILLLSAGRQLKEVRYVEKAKLHHDRRRCGAERNDRSTAKHGLFWYPTVEAVRNSKQRLCNERDHPERGDLIFQLQVVFASAYIWGRGDPEKYYRMRLVQRTEGEKWKGSKGNCMIYVQFPVPTFVGRRQFSTSLPQMLPPTLHQQGDLM